MANAPRSCCAAYYRGISSPRIMFKVTKLGGDVGSGRIEGNIACVIAGGKSCWYHGVVLLTI